jgi:hypothetical protein
MASKTKKVKRIRARKHAPNTKNIKTDQKRIDENTRKLRELASAQG